MNKMRISAMLAVVLVCAPLLDAARADVLFPARLHLTREVTDPLAGGVITVEEYCSGNRMVSVSGDRTVIVDYERQEITEIDRRAATYSVARFEEIASATRGKRAPAVKADVKVDRSVPLSREAVEALIGAAYPNSPGPEHEAVLQAAASLSVNAGNAAYGLPVMQVFTYEEGGSAITIRSAITRVGTEDVPSELVMIPRAAKRVQPAPLVSKNYYE